MDPRLKRRLFGTLSFQRVLLSIVCIYVMLAALVYFVAPWLIFPAPEKSSYDVTMPGLAFVENASGETTAIIYSPPERGKPTLLASHGNAEDAGDFAFLFSELQQAGYGLLIYDYPGYGLSSGKPSEEGCYEAIAASWAFLTEAEGIAPADILIVGRSVGSGPSTWLAAGPGQEARGLVLLSPFTSAFRSITQVPVFPGDRFVNIDRIANVTMPILIMHGTEDRVIPFSHSAKLARAAVSSPSVIEVPLVGADHNDLTKVWKQIVYEIYFFTNEEGTL